MGKSIPSVFKKDNLIVCQNDLKQDTDQSLLHLSYDVASGSEITPCNKIGKPLVVYRFTGNVMTFIATVRT